MTGEEAPGSRKGRALCLPTETLTHPELLQQGSRG